VPEARLALAVLEDAVSRLQLSAGVNARAARATSDEIWAWIVAEGSEHPFAFVTVCDWLELEPNVLRARLRRWYRRR
jgi:hypothetical protein